MVLEYQPFCVQSDKFVAVYWDLSDANRAFLESFDPTYFVVLSEHHNRQIEVDPEHKLLHATQLKLIYCQALETLFARLFALLQAPFCTLALLQLYHPGTLAALADIVSQHQEFDYFKMVLENISWWGIARLMTPCTGEPESDADNTKRIEILLESLAKDFTNSTYSEEYNSIKHGFRARPGGFSLSIGKGKGSMSPVGQSDFGSSFISIDKTRKLGRKGDLTKAFSLRRTSVNWDPQYFTRRIGLIGNILTSVSNIARELCTPSGTGIDLWYCGSDDAMQEYLINRTGVFSVDIDQNVDLLAIPEQYLKCDHRQYYSNRINLRRTQAI